MCEFDKIQIFFFVIENLQRSEQRGVGIGIQINKVYDKTIVYIDGINLRCVNLVCCVNFVNFCV